MPSAQQKAKRAPGVQAEKRNSNRKNGKAAAKATVNKGKPSGNSFCGISVRRIQRMALNRGVTVQTIKDELLQKRADRKLPITERTGYKARKARQAERAREMAGVDA